MKTLVGDVVYERAYYHCECGTGHCPTDEEFGIESRKSPGAREVQSLAGTLDPFDGGEFVLHRMSGLLASASTIRRTTEEVGADVAALRAAGETIGPEHPWDWNVDLVGRAVAYVSLDATGVPQQGPRGEKREGRMPWVGAVFNPVPRGEPNRRVWESRYVSGLMSLPEIGAQLRRECTAVGLGRADVVVALTDGGAGLEDCLLDAVAGIARDVEFVLDFWHAADHLREFAKVLVPDDEAERKRRVESWCHTLKHSGGEVLLAELESLDLAEATAATREEHRLLTGYLRSNLHRTDYPRYLANGWQIGSGVIESACKGVVAERLKGRGMRWREEGTTALCQLRALYKSQPDLWTHYWRQSQAP